MIFILMGELSMSQTTNTSQKDINWERTHRTWNNLRKDNLQILDDYYDEKINFIDPLGSVNGIAQMKGYYQHLYQTVEDIKFVFTDKMIEDRQQFFAWTMKLKAKGLNDGKELVVYGTSHIKFSEQSNKVIYHRDYFDTGEFVYSNIPILKWVHQVIKSKMHPSSLNSL